MTQGERIREIRKYFELTLEKFGEKLGVGKTAISKIENNERGVTDQMIKGICREFNIRDEWLRTGEGEMFEQMTQEEKLMKYTALLLKNEDSAVANAIQTLIITYEQLDDASKATLEKIALQYIDNLKKSQ